MSQHFIAYTVIHQPRRLRLPARPIPAGASPEDIARCLFDEEMNQRYLEQVAQKCYQPATAMFQDMVENGFKLGLGMSLSFLRQAEQWDPELLASIRKLVAHPNVEMIAVEPYHSFLFYVDIRRFVERMTWVRDELERRLGKRPRVSDTTEMFMANDIYFALRAAGYEGAVLDGREWVLQWREPTYLYHYRQRPYLLCRHFRLSDDVGYRFSNRGWEGWPLRADTYAHWVREAQGDFVFVGWDYETFGEHHWQDTGIFEFARRLPEELRACGMEFATPGEAIDLYQERAHHLPLPEFPTTWAGSGGVEFFLSNGAQQAVFQLMHHAYNKALLTGQPALIDLAMWLLQSDNLHLIQWFGRLGQEAEVSAYFTPREWWELGPVGIVTEIQNVYKQFIRALDAAI
ncbi:MAG: glycoside hydrolase [Armatimonadetes bacterium]|nr:glycoside hydrolase [Armatimonadota bacterium]